MTTASRKFPVEVIISKTMKVRVYADGYAFGWDAIGGYYSAWVRLTPKQVAEARRAAGWTPERIVRISTRPTSTNFGCLGVIKARNGRVIAETTVFAHGCDHLAREAAETLAARNGWTVAA
jgi:hypothetical protein